MCVFVADTRQVLMQLFFSVFHGFVVRGCRRTGCNALRYSIEARLAGRHAQARVVESTAGREALELVVGINLVVLADEVAGGRAEQRLLRGLGDDGLEVPGAGRLAHVASVNNLRVRHVARALREAGLPIEVRGAGRDAVSAGI